MRMVKSRYRMDDCMILCTQGDVIADTKQPTDYAPIQILLARMRQEDKGRRYV